MTQSPSTLALILGLLVLQSLQLAPCAAAENAAVALPLPATTDASAETLKENATRQALADRERLSVAIIELETREGSYSPAASEAYLDYGNALHTLELDEEALQSYGKALQALRVSNGLYDLQQIAVLRQQAIAQEALEDWEDVDATRHLIYYISMKRLPAGTPARFDALLELARWKFKAAEQELLSGGIDSSFQSVELYSNEIGAMEKAAAYPEKNIQLGLLYLELAAVEYQQARHKYSLPLSEWQTSHQRSTTQLQCQVMRLPDGRSMQFCQNVEVPNMDYYMAPTVRKNQEVGNHLENMKDAVSSAYENLQQDTAFPEDRNELLAEVQKLTHAYNEFLKDNDGR